MVGMGRPKFLLGMPNSRALEPEIAQSFWSDEYPADRRTVEITERIICSSSVLTSSINKILARALDGKDQGRFSHLAIQHDDVSPPSWWVSDLYHEMLIRNAHIISAVLAIKLAGRAEDPTSTAVGRVDDPWKIVRHVKVDELRDLPRTFCSQHVCQDGECLLVNTGLWIADLTAPFWDEFEGFNMQTRILRHENHREPQQRTEDWEFSRFLHAQGARYYATSGIAADHLGIDRWKIR